MKHDITKPCFFFFAFLLLKLDKTCFSNGCDTLLVGQSLSVSQTLISQGNVFELGFFQPGKGSSLNIYLGIWYKNFADRIQFLGTANRESPLNDLVSIMLEVSADGNLMLFTKFTKTIWSHILHIILLYFQDL